MKEIWKPVSEYEGFYEVSNMGRVRSVLRKVNAGNGKLRTADPRIIKPTDNGNGYLIVGLSKNGKRVNYYVHRLVASHFVGNIEHGMVINHLDYDKTNNKADNLEIVSQLDNIRYSVPNMCRPKNCAYSNTGEKYICKRKTRSGTRFRVVIRQLGVDFSCKTLEEAIVKRRDAINDAEYFKQCKEMLSL